MIADDVTVNDLAVNVKGDLYFTDSAAKKVWLHPEGRQATHRRRRDRVSERRAVLAGSDAALCFGLRRPALVGVPDSARRIARAQAGYFYVHMPDAATRSGADGMAADANGSVYIATSIGVQVFDQIGKCHAIIPAPLQAPLSNVEVRRSELRRALHHERRQVFKRKMKMKGVLSWRPPIKPAEPRL